MVWRGNGSADSAGGSGNCRDNGQIRHDAIENQQRCHRHDHSQWDMVAFTPAFVLAIYWRKKPEFHRRLILIATCVLTAAGWGRFPEWLPPPVISYAGVDLPILLGVFRDWMVNRKVHLVYSYALPALIAGQTVVMYANVHKSAVG
jgi:hypothetical protein